ncbi:YlaH-like family protein [Paenibacillus ginsengihumi]|uniref:YlaH-like family protein n=1 Tax=Paenibacillus ginsengihumi TaxID=431596 RepID=UPI00036B5F2C|nr:YlaH-like family protein [Paenibacillus ginsengihumi]
MREWFLDHPWITYLIIFVLITYVYNKVFRARKLPLLKDLIIYLLLALGSIMLLFFQLAGLPIVPSLSIAVILMLIVRIRYFIQERQTKTRKE